MSTYRYLGPIKALSSQESLTSSQEEQENEREPRICFNSDCLFPLGPACAECLLEIEETEKRRAEYRLANRGLVTPINEEEIGEDPLESMTSSSSSASVASFDTFVPNPRNKKSFEHLTDIYPDSKSFTDLRAVTRKESLDHLVEENANSLVVPTKEAEIGQDRLEYITSQNASVATFDTVDPNPRTRNKKSFQNLTDVYADTKPKESFTDLRAGSRKVVSHKSRPSLVSPSTTATTTVTIEATKAVPRRTSEKPETLDERIEFSNFTSELERVCSTQDTVAPSIEDWLESLPDFFPEESLDGSLPNCKLRHSEPSSSASQKSIQQQPRQQSLCKVRRKIQQNPELELCPLCSNPVGDYKYQHIANCKYAHEEREREELAKQRALARGQEWEWI